MEISSKKPSRKSEISLLNLLFFFMVIFIHVTSEPITALTPGTWQYLLVFIPWRLCGVAVYGFILLSAVKLFMGFDKPFSYKHFYLSRLTKIVLPYAFFTLLYCLYQCYAGHIPFTLQTLFHFLITGKSASHLYFVIIIMQFYLLMPLWRKMVRRLPAIFAIPASIFIMLFLWGALPYILSLIKPGFTYAYNDRTFTTYLAFWVSGCYIGANYESFKALITKNIMPLFWLAATSGLAAVYLGYTYYTTWASIPGLNTVFVLYCISMTLWLYAMALKPKPLAIAQNSILRRLDAESYMIYLSHMGVLLLTNELLDRFSIVSIAPRYIIRIVVVYGVSLLFWYLWDVAKSKLRTK